MHGAVEHRVRAAVRLRAVHRHVGVADQVLGRDVRAREGDADGGGHDEVAAGHGDRLRERELHALGHRGRLARIADVLQQHGELVAAQPGDGVARTERPAQPARDGLEELVAGLVPEGVVDRLEAVEVEEQHRAAPTAAAPARAPQRPREAVEEERAVRQAGERVVQHVVAEAVDGAPVLDGVADRPVQHRRREPPPRQVVHRAASGRLVDLRGPALVVQHDDRRLGPLLQEAAERVAVLGLCGQQDHVVRVLLLRGQRGADGGHAVQRVRILEEVAHEAVVRVVGGDEQEDGGGGGHRRGRGR